jgi:hypothetical protein
MYEENLSQLFGVWNNDDKVIDDDEVKEAETSQYEYIYTDYPEQPCF